MFTGIIRNLGTLTRSVPRGRGRELWIQDAELAPKVALGDSVSINGCCLSVEKVQGDAMQFYCTPETLDRTSLDALTHGSRVNLELPLRPSDRLGGHFVQGHVDGVGRVEQVREVGGSWVFRFRAPGEVMRYLVAKGSVAVDGISLTVAALEEDSFEVAVIPETWERTTLSGAGPGTPVNLEVDLLAKYVERFLEGSRDAERPGTEFAEKFRHTLGEDA